MSQESQLEKFRNEHLEATKERWRFAAYRATQVLCDPDPVVRTLAKMLFTVHSSTRWKVLGGPEAHSYIDLGSYGERIPYYPLDMMEFVPTFVEFYLGKHREIGVAYFRYANTDDLDGEEYSEYYLCDKHHPDAMPYFHRSYEGLVMLFPGAERLTIERAIEILEWYEGEREEALRVSMREKEQEGYWDDDDTAMYQLSEEDKAYAALAEELIRLGPVATQTKE